MASLNWYLKDPNASGKTAIYALLSDGRNFKFKFYPGISIKAKNWSKRQTVRSNDPAALSYNKEIKFLTNAILDAYMEARRMGVPFNKKYLMGIIRPIESKELTFWSSWREFINFKDNEWSERTKDKYLRLQGHLLSIDSIDRINLNQIDDLFIRQVQNQLSVHMVNKSINVYVGLFKSYLNWAFRKGYIKNDLFKSIKPLKEPNELKVILTEEEEKRIEELDLGQKYLMNARNLFILSCHTGLRHSDLVNIGPDNLRRNSDGPFLYIKQKKTGNYVAIPVLNKRVEGIILGILRGEIHPISNQKLNQYLKELGKAASISETIKRVTYRLNNEKFHEAPKYTFLTSHVGRRTFATRAVQKGVAPEIVMKITGHSSVKTFMEYVNIPSSATLKLLRNSMGDAKNEHSYMEVS